MGQACREVRREGPSQARVLPGLQQVNRTHQVVCQTGGKFKTLYTSMWPQQPRENPSHFRAP